MSMKNEEQIVRTTPDYKQGLSIEDIEQRTKLGLVNKTKIVVGKTYLEIILTLLVVSLMLISIFILKGRKQ